MALSNLTSFENLQTERSKPSRVLVAMSGGVDSSVAAALLVEQGYEVIGCTMQVWDYSQCETDLQEGYGTCCSSIDVDDARTVADKLDIPFYVINCEKEFKSKVIDPFVQSYLEGKTPIPCVNCNTFLKFDYLLKKMRALNCDFLATGHYAQMALREGKKVIQTSWDDWKDQTYFLFTLNTKILDILLFPIGNMEKSQVRQYALDKNLSVAQKKDSTGICFIGNGKYSKFVKERGNPELIQCGELRKYPSGEILGQHEGVYNFTYGQRKGLGISYSVPLYVKKIDPSTQTVWLAEEQDLYEDQMYVKDFNELDEFEENELLSVKVRFQHRGALAQVKKVSSDLFKVSFEEPQRSLTPGQAAVFYRNKQLLGGGWIV